MRLLPRARASRLVRKNVQNTRRDDKTPKRARTFASEARGLQKLRKQERWPLIDSGSTAL